MDNKLHFIPDGIYVKVVIGGKHYADFEEIKIDGTEVVQYKLLKALTDRIGGTKAYCTIVKHLLNNMDDEIGEEIQNIQKTNKEILENIGENNG